MFFEHIGHIPTEVTLFFIIENQLGFSKEKQQQFRTKYLE